MFAVEAKIIFSGPPPLYPLYPAGPKGGGHCPPTSPGCTAHDLFVENRKIFIPHLYLARRNFVKIFDADKTRIIGVAHGPVDPAMAGPIISQTSALEKCITDIDPSLSSSSSWVYVSITEQVLYSRFTVTSYAVEDMKQKWRL